MRELTLDRALQHLKNFQEYADRIMVDIKTENGTSLTEHNAKINFKPNKSYTLTTANMFFYKRDAEKIIKESFRNENGNLSHSLDFEFDNSLVSFTTFKGEE